MMNPKKTASLRNSIVENLDIRELADREPKIKITGNGEAVFQGCNGVSDYGENAISLVTGNTVVVIRGSELELLSLDGDEAVVKGIFTAIEFT